MSNVKWGEKRLCPGCDARFYDLGRNPAECPKCGKKFDPTTQPKMRRGKAIAKRKAAEKKEKDVKAIAMLVEKAKAEAEDEPKLKGAADIGDIEEMDDSDDIDDLAELDDVETPKKPDDSADDASILAGIDASLENDEDEADEAEDED